MSSFVNFLSYAIAVPNTRNNIVLQDTILNTVSLW